MSGIAAAYHHGIFAFEVSSGGMLGGMHDFTREVFLTWEPRNVWLARVPRGENDMLRMHVSHGSIRLLQWDSPDTLGLVPLSTLDFCLHPNVELHGCCVALEPIG